MKIIFILLIIALGICSCTNKNECKAITLEKKYIGNQEDLIIDLNYSTDKKAINLSILNVGKDSIVFTLPKLNFVLIENNNKINKDDDVIKPYTPYVHISKSISYIKNGSNIKNISTDFTMQRNEESIPIKIGFKEKFIKELYIDCKKSDIGDYMIYFLAKNNSNNDKLIQIQYPREVILKIKK